MAKSSILVAALVAVESAEGVEPDLENYTAAKVLEGSTCELKANDIDPNPLNTTFSKEGTLAGEANWELKLNLGGRGCDVDGSGNPVLPDLHPLLVVSGFAQSTAYALKVSGVTGTWAVFDTLKKTTTVIGTIVGIEDKGGGVKVFYVKGANAVLAAADEVTNDTATATVASVAEGFMYWFTSNSSLIKTASIRWYEDGIIKVANAVRATLEMEFPVSDFPKFNFTCMGTYNEPADLAMSAALPTKLPLLRGVAVGLKVGTYEPAGVSSLKVSPGWEIQKRQDMNGAEGLTGFDLVDRKPTVNFNPFAESIAAYNPYVKWKNSGERLPLVAHFSGSGEANNLSVIIPAAQYQAPQTAPNNKRQAYNQTLNMCGTKGDDEFFMYFGKKPA